MSQANHPTKIKTRLDLNRNLPPRTDITKRAVESKGLEWPNMADRGPYHPNGRRFVDITEKAEEVLSPRPELVKRAGEAKQVAGPNMSDADLGRLRSNARRLADTAKEAAEANICELDRHAERMLRLEMGEKMRDERTPEAVRRTRRERMRTIADLKKRVVKGEYENDIFG